MPFDLQSILAALGMGGGPQLPLGSMQGMGGFMAGNAPAANAGVNTGPTQVPTPPPAPSAPGLAGLFGLSPDALKGFGSPGGISGSGLAGPLSLLGAGASMLNASGPGNAGLGSIVGSGIGGLMAGAGADRAQSLQEQQQAALQRIAEQLMKQPSGAQPAASSTTPIAPPPAPPVPVMNAARPAPQVPGAPPAPGITGQAVMGGGMPMGGGGGQQPNPFIQMMLQRRMGRMA